MRHLPIALCIALTACGQAAPPPPAPAPTATNPTWFICDGINAPTLLHVERQARTVRVIEYDKPNGAIVSRSEFGVGAQDVAGGSVYTSLLQDGRETGAVRETNASVLETPGAAYTPRITEVRLGERIVTCRWLPRTRLSGFTGRRSVVVHEDADGDLIYTTYDFTGASAATPIELGDNGITTTFSAEARGGAEHLSPAGASYEFQGPDGFSYLVAIEGGEGRLEVRREDAVVQTEPLIGFQIGDAAN